MKSILDRSFVYTPAAKTDIGKTFRRIRREQEANQREVVRKVSTLPAERRKHG